MARYKKAKGAGSQGPSVPHAGLPCVVLIIIAIIFTMAVMYWALKSSGS